MTMREQSDMVGSLQLVQSATDLPATQLGHFGNSAITATHTLSPNARFFAA